MITLSSFIRWHARETPQRVALTYQGHETSYAALNATVEAAAGLLKAQGVGPDTVVALLMKNSPAFIEAAMAISHLGGIYLPLNFRLSGEEVTYITGDASAKLILVDEELLALAPAALPRIVITPAAQADLAALAEGHAPISEPAQRQPSDLFRLMYTSGTTARPKGVMHSYENFYFKSADHVNVLGLDAETRLLTVGPLYHVGAFDLPGVAVLMAGGMMAIHRDFDPAAVLASIERERLNAAWLAPVMTTALLTSPEAGNHDLSSLRWVVGGGERTPESRIVQFGKLFPNARYIDAYGLTESGSGDTFMTPGRELEKIGSAGRTTMHVALSIRDDDGNGMPTGEEGEICLCGPKVTKGYWNDPEKTASAFFPGGWFRTGDVGYLDEEGFLFITDRKKDMIISGGENIASSEVERAIQMLPQVLECAVIGVPDERWGERPMAVIVPAPGATLDPDEVKAHCRTQLAAFKVPDRIVLRDDMPRNASGKVLKRELRTLLLG
jgi:fatty-acyl-CoA synthase